MAEHVKELIQRIANDPLVALVRKNQPKGPWRLFLVGGAIRDFFLERPLVDRDFVVDGDTLEFTKRLAEKIGASYVPLEEQWNMVRLVLRRKGKKGLKESYCLDFAGLCGKTIEEDLFRRDFTINAMAMLIPKGPQMLPGTIEDPTMGLKDLKEGILRLVNPENLRADPIRVLRAFRLNCSLGFRIQRETQKELASHAKAIQSSAGERIRDELMKLLGCPSSLSSIKEMESIGLLWEIFPECRDLMGIAQGIYHPYDAWQHTLETFKNLESLFEKGYVDLSPWDDALRTDMEKNSQTIPLLKMTALLHDVGKPLTRSIGKDRELHFYGHEHRGAQIVLGIAKRLRLSRMDQTALYTWVRYHMWPLHMHLAASRMKLSERAQVRFFRRMGIHAIGILILAMADDAAKTGSDSSGGQASPFITFVKSLLNLYYTKDAAGIRSPPLITGHDLIQHFGLEPGPQIGRLLEAVHEARVEGQVCNSKEALEFVGTLITDK